MSNPAVKQTAVELLVGAALCGAAFMFGLKPLEAKLDQARAKAAGLESQIATGASETLTIDQTVKLVTDARQRVKLARERSEPARDEGATFGAVMALASKHGVRVDQLQPAAPRALKTKAPEPAPAPVTNPMAQLNGAAPQAPAPVVAAAPVNKDRRAGCAMTISGDYAGVVSFVRALERDMGFTLVRSVRLTPIGDTSDKRVSCAIETEHLALDTSQAKFADATPKEASR